MLKAIIFDFGSTLVHSKRWIEIEVETIVKDSLNMLKQDGIVNLEMEELILAQNFYIGLKNKSRETGKEITAFNLIDSVLNYLGKKIEKDIIDNAIEKVYRQCFPTIKLGNGVKETLNRLTKKGYILGIISNAHYSPCIFWVLDKFDIRRYFDEVIVSADVGKRKPFPEIFNLALNRLNIKTEEAAFVGDYYPYDIVGAKNIGMKTFWITSKDKSEKGEHADFLISEIGEILNYIDN
jgi:putative hydrolase of the HAD superfamily